MCERLFTPFLPEGETHHNGSPPLPNILKIKEKNMGNEFELQMIVKQLKRIADALENYSEVSKKQELSKINMFENEIKTKTS